MSGTDVWLLRLKDKEEIGLLKIHFNSAELVRDLPPPYLSFMQHLQVRRCGSNKRTRLSGALCPRNAP